MIIEVTGVSTWNKGAELMLVAIREHFEQRYPEIQLAVDQHFGSYAERAQYGLLQKAHIKRFGRSKMALALMPASFRKSYGLVIDRDISAVLDAAGFAFGDQHPVQRAASFAQRLTAARSQGKKIVLLPQALGPFENPDARHAFQKMVAAADLVFARDPTSLAHAKGAAGQTEKIRMAPDFTNLVKPMLRRESKASDVVTIVPNQRMVEKAPTQADANAYVPFLATCVRAVKAKGLQPRILIHGKHDADLLNHLVSAVGHDLFVIQEEDPVTIKQLLGESRAVIGSRFHALVSGLSQEVPCIATSWSHKYEMLFQDYGCEEMVLSVYAEEAAVHDRLEQAVGSGEAGLRPLLRERGALLRQQTEDMWRSVEAVLGLEAHEALRAGSNPGRTQTTQMASDVRIS